MKRLVPERLLAVLRAETATPFELPGDVVRDARHRVWVAAALGAAAYGVFLAFELSGMTGGTPLGHALDLAHDFAGFGLCALLLLVATLRPIPHRAVIGFALAAEVLLCALISLSVTWTGYIRTGHVSALTWAVPVIILFPLLLPISPKTTLMISVLGALTMPLSLWALAARGAIQAQVGDFWAATLTGGVAVGIAVIGSRTVHGAHRQAAAARTVGSYELLERIGHGGMGEVWKARHLLLARPAAIKLILPERLQGPREQRHTVTERFTREARVTASLRSPHTVELFDFGVGADGSLYYAMELLDGLNAEHFVYRFGPVEPRRAANWLVQACHSLGEAHARGLVHRDIKPGNLFLCRYGRDRDFVKVLDFGLTKLVTEPTRPTEATAQPPSPVELAGGVMGASQPLTNLGARLGTPGYMAPEQIAGISNDPRSDLYALGCVAYFLLAGSRPFEGDTVGELLRQHAHAPPAALTGRAPHPVPSRLEALILRCLSKDPADRPADADQLSAELVASIDGASWTEADAHDWWERNLADL